jgi:hypothetical protein
MAFNLGSLAPLAGLMESDKLLQQRQLNQLRQREMMQNLQMGDQQQQTLGAIGNTLGQLPQQPPIPQIPTMPQQTPQMPTPTAQMGSGGPGVVKASWYGNSPGWSDPSDSGLQAGGQPVSAGPGIALRIPKSSPDFGKSYDVTDTNTGKTLTLNQTDYGPSEKTGRGVDINSPAAQQFGYTPKSFPTDSQFVVRAHRQLDASLDQSGNKLIQQGADGPTVQDSTKAGMMAGRQIDPVQWGRTTRAELIQAIEKANPDLDPKIKALAFIQMNKILAPEEKMQAQMWAREHQQDLQLMLEHGRNTRAEDSLKERYERDLMGRGTPSPIETEQGPMAFDPRTMTAQPIMGPDGKPITGRISRPTGQPRNAPAMALRAWMDEYQAEHGHQPSSDEIRQFQAAGAEAISEGRTVGTRVAGMEGAGNAAEAIIPLVRESSHKVDRTKYPDLNSLILAYETKTGGEDVVQYGEMVNTLRYLYARALAPTGQGPRVADINHFDEIFNKNWGRGTIDAALDQIQKSINAERGAAQKTKAGITGRPAPAEPKGGGKPISQMSVDEMSTLVSPENRDKLTPEQSSQIRARIEQLKQGQ